MKSKLHNSLIVLAMLALFSLNFELSTAGAQGTAFTYQGLVTDNGTNFTGTGQFQFALVTSTNTSVQATATANMGGSPPHEFVNSFNLISGGSGYVTAPAVTITGGGGSGASAQATVTGGMVTSLSIIDPGSGYTSTPTVTIGPPPADITFVTYWSNDGTSSAGSEPTSAVSLSVSDGLFTVALGDTTLANMTAIPAAVFTEESNLQLRIWFNDGVNGFAALSPVQNLTPTPYAVTALSANTSSNLSGTVSAGQLNGTVGNSQLAHSSITLTAGTGLSGGGTVALGGATTLSNAGVLSVTGNPDITATIVGGAVTLGDTATSSDTASTIVKRDASGNFTAGTITANSFSGNGANLTSLNADNLSSGTVPLAQLSGITSNQLAAATWQVATNLNGGNAALASNVVSGIGLTNAYITNAVITNSFFAGNGGGLTNLNASQLTSGVIPLAKLPGAVVTNNDTTSVNLTGNFTGNGAGLTNLNAWALTGNTGTSPTNGNFVGTSDNQPLELWVNNARALRLEPGGASAAFENGIPTGAPNVLGGSSLNYVSNGVVGATIGGGGATNYASVAYTNSVTGDFGTVGGGYANTAGGSAATLGGGGYNTASGDSATLGGGEDNTASGMYGTVGGGGANTASDYYATVAGGLGSIASGEYATVPGGSFNLASGNWATVAGGFTNLARGDYSFAAGNSAQALNQGAFVWADSTGAGFPSVRDDQFRVHANGGVRLDLNSNNWVEFFGQSIGRPPDTTPIVINTSTGAYLSVGGSWVNSSDRKLKENFQPVNGREALEKVAALPITRWNYKTEGESVQHIGPVAQDFQAAFQLSHDDKHISTVDEGGVALAAIQGLNQKVEERDDKIQAQGAEIQALKAKADKVDAVEKQNELLAERLHELEATVRQLAARK
jgi:Chaperone of endosialidase